MNRNYSFGTAARTAVLVLAGTALAGCTFWGTVIGAGATAGIGVAQERPVEQGFDDLTIDIGIQERLLKEDFDLYRDVSVKVVEGRVLLTGTVDNPDYRVTASRLAWQSEGVREVINEIEVTDAGSWLDYPKDTWISANLRTKLLGDGDIRDINYSVETVRGTIYVMGIAQDQAELNRVVSHARTIAGAKKVVSYVHLKDDPRRYLAKDTPREEVGAAPASEQAQGETGQAPSDVTGSITTSEVERRPLPARK